MEKFNTKCFASKITVHMVQNLIESDLKILENLLLVWKNLVDTAENFKVCQKFAKS